MKRIHFEKTMTLDEIMNKTSEVMTSGHRKHIGHIVREARARLRDPDLCIATKYHIAGDTRKTIRNEYYIGVISFECCQKLQLALDY